VSRTRTSWLVLQLVAIGVGIAVGMWLFHVVTT
jgi:hypothetical protein